MTRKKLPLAVAALIAGMFGSSAVYALGLGEIKIFSHLNEPLQAEIDLVEVGDLNADEIKAKLASKEVFEKAKIDRDYFLTQIQFDVVVLPDGRGVLKLSTNNPANEPFLDFILDASWANGHVFKQYTLLLDPLTYNAEGAAPTVSKKEEAIAANVAENSAEEITQNDNQEKITNQNTSPPVVPVGTERYTTQTNDTLWRIASSHQAGGASATQTMNAIYKLNPSAFIKNNINLLKTDKTLHIPSAEEVAFLAKGGSVEQLLNAQNKPQLSTEQTVASESNSASEDKLKIVGSSSNGASTSSGTSESIDKIDRDNQDMNVRLAELTSQIQKMQQLIKMQDDQLSSLQQQLGGAPQKAEKLAAVEKLKSELAKVESEINKEPTATASAAVSTTAEPAQSTITPVVTEPSQPTAASVVTEAPTAKPIQQPVAQKPVAVTPPESVVEEKESSSIWVIWVGLLLAFAAIAVAFIKNKRKPQIDEESDWSVDALRDEPSLASTMDADDEELDQEVSAQHETVLDQTTTEVQHDVTIDPLKEANQLIDSGNLAGAINVLKEAIVQQTTRLDLRTRLLELSAQVGDIETFESQESYISRWGGAAAKKLAATLREDLNSMPAPATSTAINESSLDSDSASVFVESSTVESTQEDTSASIEHLFNELPSEATPDAAVEFNLSDFDTTLEEVAVTEPEIEAVTEPVEVAPSESIEKDALAALDHLFDDLPSEAKTEDVDFAAELGFFDEAPAIAEVEPEFEVSLASEELPSITEEEPSSVAEAKEEEVVATEVAEQEQAPIAESASEDDEFGFLAGTDEAATKLDLAKAYIEMEGFEDAKDILQEVLQEGNDEQQQEAKDLLARL